jgi:MerR family transcriptional regulator, light-induced transcriptional regulator
MAEEEPLLRIGELSRRAGVSDHVLRAWESRYDLLRPVRSPGGFRLYTEADLRRVRRMQEHLGEGLSAAQAARAVLVEDAAARPAEQPFDPPAPSEARSAGMADLVARLREVLDAFDEPGGQAVLDRLLTDFTVESVLRDALIPYLHDLGDRWARGDVSVAQEHFASHVIRGRLHGLARGWGLGNGPHAILACPPDELHDLALLAFGIVLHRAGWRISYLGTSTPFEDLVETMRDRRVDLVVLAATVSSRLTEVRSELTRLARIAPLALAGAGATPDLATQVGARLLAADPVTCATDLVS